MKKILAAIIAVATVALVTAVVARPWEPALPVDVSFRNSHWDASQVAQIHNESAATRKVLVSIQSPAIGQTANKIELIPARGMIEIGWLEGWRFVSGEKLQIHQSGFKDYSIVVP